MKKKIWRCFKKGFWFGLIITIINYVILYVVAINIETAAYNLQTLGLTAILLIIGMIIIKGYFIEYLDKKIK